MQNMVFEMDRILRDGGRKKKDGADFPREQGKMVEEKRKVGLKDEEE